MKKLLLLLMLVLISTTLQAQEYEIDRANYSSDEEFIEAYGKNIRMRIESGKRADSYYGYEDAPIRDTMDARGHSNYNLPTVKPVTREVEVNNTVNVIVIP